MQINNTMRNLNTKKGNQLVLYRKKEKLTAETLTKNQTKLQSQTLKNLIVQ